MNKTIRTVMVLTSLALTSALLGVSINLGALPQGRSIDIAVEGDYDGLFSLVNADTKEEAAFGVFFAGGWPQPSYCGFGDSDTLGILIDVHGDIATISGIPAGNYRLELSAFGPEVTPYSGFSDGSGYAYFWDGNNWINFDFDVLSE